MALEKRAAFVTFLILFSGGFLILLGNLSLASFVDSITVDIGSLPVKQPELGTARYEIMADIGYISMTLGIISILSYTYPKSRFWSSILLFSAALFTILFTIESGSRIGVVFTVVQYILLAVWFGYKPNRNFIVLGVLLTLVILGSITVIRGNRFLERNSTGILTQVITGEAGQTGGGLVCPGVGGRGGGHGKKLLAARTISRLGDLCAVINAPHPGA